ncbi:DUF4115 domain-containing protein [Altererythrobacter salegens]|uniref:DUF4115 domain-containing protein n=1 Tax=Croceibacterium salegens TaxID=1737568 RepID=A0A6I4T0U7_9SPHN|nr:helix-turn-helix domain-containing protein [Croceibacterium salegens]MXO60877.1 DUF4115 domain-containing protein [Croceibacterium salegens]
MDDTDVREVMDLPQKAGPRLRAARETLGLTLEQVAAQTRIPQRHLKTIEAGEYSDLPGRTYAVGFARTYAKTVNLDPEDLVSQVRAELDEQNYDRDFRAPETFEPGDPARVPSRSLGWFAIFALGLLIVGGFFFFRAMFTPAGELPSLVAEKEATPAPQQKAAAKPAAIDPSGAVVFTALEEGIWVKFYDANNRQLMQKQMALGETYTVPQDATGPQVWTGRPDAFGITIGGRAVPKLAEGERVMKDVPVTAEALLARPPAPVQPAGENTAAPAG